MTAMATDPVLPTLTPPAADGYRTDTARRIDAAVKANRAVTPPAAVNARATSRMSIEELNNVDLQTLHEKLQAHPLHDDRPAFVKALDVLDLPRNALWNILAPSIAARKKAAGETETFGLGAVHFSDVLDEMGVHNHVARGILGFVGDLATDPLMYLGPVGGTARALGAGGKVVEITRPGVKALRAADEALSGGWWVDEAAKGGKEVGGLLRAAGHTPESVVEAFRTGAPLDAAASKLALGDVQGGPIASRVLGEKAATSLADRLSRVGRAGFEAKGGAIADQTGQGGLSEIQRAADAFHNKFGVVNTPGIKIGGGGQSVFHIPLTDYDIQIPSLTGAAKQRIGVAAAARSVASGAGLSNKAVSPDVLAAHGWRDTVEAAAKAHEQATAAEDAVTARMSQIKDSHPDPTVADSAGIQLDAHLADIDNARQLRSEARDAALANFKATLDKAVSPATPTSAADLVALRPLIDQAAGYANKFAAEGKGITDTIARHADLEKQIEQFTSAVPEGMQRRIARDDFVSKLPEADRDLLTMSKDDLARASMDADWLHARMDANVTLAKATGASVFNYIDNEPDRAMVAAAMRVLQTDSGMMGSSVMTPLKSALELVGLKNSTAFTYAQKAENFLDRMFGSTSGELGRMDRWVKNTMTNESRQAAQEAVLELSKQIKGALGKAGLDPVEHLDDIAVLMHALAVDEASKGAAGSKFRVWTTEFGTGEMSDYLKDIAKAQETGVFSKDVTGSLEVDLREIARGKTGLNLLKMLGDMETTDELLTKTIPGAVPLVATKEARNAIQTQAEYSLTKEGASKTAQNVRGMAAESFQKQRQASLEYRFTNAAGQERRFLHSDLGWWGALTDAEKEAMAADPSAKDVSAMIADIGEYMAMPVKPEPKYLDARAMNKMYQDGRFNMLTGGRKLPGGFMDANLLSLMAARVGAHERAAAKASMIEYLHDERFGVSMHPKDVEGIMQKIGHKLTLKNGATAEVIWAPTLSGTNVPAMKIGGQIYRPLSKEVGALKSNPIINAMDLHGENTGRYFYDKLANKIEAAAKTWQSDDDISIWLRAMDKVTGEWKRLALFHPAFLVNNLITDNLNAVFGGARIADYLKHNAKMVRVVLNQHDPAALEKIVFDVRGQKITGRQLWHDMVQHRVGEMTMASELPNQLIQSGFMSMPSAMGERGAMGAVKNPVRAGQMIGKDFLKLRDQYSMAAGLDKPGVMQNVRAGDHVFDDRIYQWLFGPWQRLNQQVSNAGRGLAYLSHLEQGHDPVSAAAKTIDSMFDYCVDESTEILTEHGWLTLDEVKVGDNAFTIDPKTGEAKFEPISAVNIFPAKERSMCRFSNGSISALSTEHHRWVCAGSGMHGGHWTLRKNIPFGHFDTSAEIERRCTQVIRSGGGEYAGPDYPVYSDEFVRLVGWVVTEGSFLKAGCGVVVSQSVKHNPGYVDDIAAIGDHYKKKGATISRYERDVGWGTIATFYFGKGIGKTIREVCPRKQLTARFLMALTRQQLHLLYKILMQADGHTTKASGTEIFAQKDKGRIDAFQMLCAMIGRRTRSKPAMCSPGCSVITAYKSKDTYAHALQCSREAYHGRVWCPTTPTGTWYARHRGYTFWTGNTHMSQVERNVFRRIFPWYAWIKNNGVYQAKLLLERPIIAGSVPLLQNAIEEALAGNDRIPMSQRPDWMRQQLAFQMGANPDHPAFLMSRSLFPPEQAITQLESIIGKDGIADFLHYFTSQLNPLITKPIEVGTGREFFSGREINPDPLLSEVSGMGMAGSLFPPLSQIQGVAKATREGGPVAGAERFVLGGRIQNTGPDRLHQMRLRDFKNEEEGLRRTIRRSETAGDHATSIRARVRQMQLYTRMAQAGFENEVPRWARKQLGTMQEPVLQ